MNECVNESYENVSTERKARPLVDGDGHKYLKIYFKYKYRYVEVFQIVFQNRPTSENVFEIFLLNPLMLKGGG